LYSEFLLIEKNKVVVRFYEKIASNK
jgi:hypothetical protein